MVCATGFRSCSGTSQRSAAMNTGFPLRAVLLGSKVGRGFEGPGQSWLSRRRMVCESGLAVDADIRSSVVVTVRNRTDARPKGSRAFADLAQEAFFTRVHFAPRPTGRAGLH